MDYDPRDNRYEQLYEELRSRAEQVHNRNKSRIKWGSISLVVLPVILLVVRWLTDSDKMVFLLVWVFCLFALAAFLIGVEYLDYTIQKTLREITDRAEEFDDLLQPRQELSRVKGRVSGLQERVDTQELLRRYGEDGDEQ